MSKVIEKISDAWETYSTGTAILTIIGIVIGTLAFSFGIMCLQALFVMLLWNWVAVELFSLPVLGFWKAFGLNWLCSLLFKSSTTVKKSKD